MWYWKCLCICYCCQYNFCKVKLANFCLCDWVLLEEFNVAGHHLPHQLLTGWREMKRERGREEGWRGRGGKARQGTIKICEHRNYLVSISFQVDAYCSLLCCPAHYIHCPHHTREPPVPYGSTHPSYSTPTHSWPSTHCTPYVLALVGAVQVTAEGADRLLKVPQATPAIRQWVTRTNTQPPSTQYTKMYPLKGLLFRYQ